MTDTEHVITEDGGQLAQPPTYVIEAARLQAIQSPCSKSKRGVVLFNEERVWQFVQSRELFAGFDPRESFIGARGFNGPPSGFVCGDSALCRDNCGRVCMHAEQRAILQHVANDEINMDLVHLKVIDGVVVAGGPPSCLECSRLVVEVGLRGVWLFESTDWVGKEHEPPPCECGALGSATYKMAVCHQPTCPRMLLFSEWRHYSAAAFHRATLRYYGLLDLAIAQLAAGGAL